MRKSVLPWLACAAIALIAVPAFASGAASRGGAPAQSTVPAAAPTVTFKTSTADAGFVVGDNFFRDIDPEDPDDNVVYITGGQTVSFVQEDSHQIHNVAFIGTQPASCTQLTGEPIDSNTTAPMPDLPQGPSWTGECRFTSGDTYDFFCVQHPDMVGQVVVEGESTPTPTATPTVTPTVTPTGPSIVARDFTTAPFYRFQDASSSDPADNSVTVAPGGTVNFSYPVGTNYHNVDFRSNPQVPTSGPQPVCVQTAGTVYGAVPPLPTILQGPGWAGYCTFNTSGTFFFLCSVHPDMTGTVIVESETPPPPETTIDSGPGGITNQTSASFTFSSNQSGASFECRLDRPAGAGTYAACTSPASFTTAADGNYTFSVRAVFPAGNPDPTPATRSFTVDTGPPDTTINGGPTGTVNTTSQSFLFSGTESGLTFECRLDTPAAQGTFSLCVSPQGYTTTANGAYTFHVRARDAAGNVDPSPATQAFTVDTVAPETTITSGPTGTTNNASPSFGFSSSESGSSFECRLDGPGGQGTYVACTSPRAVGPLADGSYTFNVRATDAAGNTDATPATRSFTVDTAAPDTSITGGPSGLTNTTAASFTFTSTKPGGTFECRLDTPAGNGTFAACTSPANYTTTANGAYTFHVRAIDSTGTPDPSPATRAFTVDTVAPDTTIDSGPTGTITNASPQFTFNSEAGATFECRLDGPGGSTGTYQTCTSPRILGSLADGSYTFLVRASDAAGNTDASPATRTFTVDTTAPQTTIDSGPTGTITNASPQFTFSSEAGATFECRLDGPGGATGTYASCTSPRTLGPLADGTYTLLVRASDVAGNTDASPATRTFTVDTTPPDTTIASGPTGTTNATSAAFGFTSEAGVTFECRLDTPAGNGTFAACTSPQTYTTTANGAYTFHVRATDAAGNVDPSPATRSFTVDIVAPDTTIASGPQGPTNATNASFTFTSEPGVTFECRLDSAAFASCTSPQAYSGLADGEHTFAVRAIDAAGNVDASPATRTFTVDTAAPDTTINTGPSGAVNTTSASFTFSGTEAGVTFECRLDGAAFTSCTSPQAYSALADGEHTFAVRAIDAAGNVDASPATRTFTVDTAAPDTTINTGPSGAINTTSASFTFSGTEAGVTFECRLDGAAFASCTSPQAYSALADGEHTFAVRAIDAAGNVDASPATRTFTVDTAAPDTTINSGPTGTINTASPEVTFSSSEPGSTFECRLDGPGSATGTYATCTSPRTLGPVVDGAYTFLVRAIDAAGNTDGTPASRTFTVETSVPDTGITSGPTGATNTASPQFAFESTKPGSTFECRLDGPGGATGTYAACTSPRTLGPLVDGAYTFLVRATDGAGNVDPTPASRGFTVDTAAPDTTIATGPTGTINTNSPQFTFNSEAGATFECRLDGPGGSTGTYQTCTSPRILGSLADGSYTFLVRASDAAGNTDASPATRTFTVDTTAPQTTIDSGPTGTIGSTSATFTFSSSEPGSTFECRLDDAAFTTCTSPREYTGLAAGEHTFAVRATDATGNTDATPATRTFTVDSTAPETTITSGPTGVTNNASPSFAFESSKPNSTFECRLDDAAFAACTSPQAYTNLAAGEHTFAVRARDAAGNVDPSPATRTFTVDTTAPQTTIDSGPTGTIGSTSATFTFSSSEPGSTFECRLDDAAFAACTSPREYTGLAAGEHTFAVRATDAAGNTDASPATRTFTVDSTAPETTITSGPTGVTNTASPSFGFESSKPNSTFECRLDGPGGQGTYVACTSPRTVGPLADGAYTFNVRATDAAGNADATPATRAFTIDTTAPDTTITGGPTGAITEHTQAFTFTSEPGATFECRLDTPAGAGTFSACTSPRQYTEAALGDYTFHVRATDAAGNVDATPATRTFRIEPVVTPTPTPTVTPTPTPTVTPTPTAVEEDSQVRGTVPTMLSLTLSGSAAFSPFIPGVGADYSAALSALITSSAETAELSVFDPSGVQPGRLTNGAYSLTDPLNVRAVNATQTNPAFGAISATPRTLLAYPSYIAGDTVTLEFRQTVSPTEPLLAGTYDKTLTFTLSTTQP